MAKVLTYVFGIIGLLIFVASLYKHLTYKHNKDNDYNDDYPTYWNI